MSGLFGSVTIKGNRITEFAQQTAAVGIPMPFGYGKFPCDGNVIFAALPPKEHVKKKKQGKGGVKTEEYSYTLSYSVGFCEGPIYGFWIIERDGKVVYTQDPNAPIEDLAFAAKWQEKATFYYGTETQMPDSTIESYKGVGQVSAMRGVVHVVLEDDDVTPTGGAAPSYRAIVMGTPPEAYLTSHPYPIIVSEAAVYGLLPTDGELRTIMHETTLPLEEAVYGLLPLDGELRDVFNSTTLPAERASYGITPTSGLLESKLRSTGAEPNKATYSITPTGGELDTVLISTNVQPSKATYGITPTGGTLA